jgi:hypothetical protein
MRLELLQLLKPFQTLRQRLKSHYTQANVTMH